MNEELQTTIKNIYAIEMYKGFNVGTIRAEKVPTAAEIIAETAGHAKL